MMPELYVEPEETTEQKRERVRKSLGVSSLNATFDNFKSVKGTEKALSLFKALASGKTDWKMLLCYGGVGNGKTHLCEATAIELCKRGIFCRVMTMAKMMQSLKRGMEPEATWPYGLAMEVFCKSERLIVDDVGMGGSGSSWEWGQLEEVIVERYRERLFTILTTNLDIKADPKRPDLAFVPERIVSRFRDPAVGRLVLNNGGDYRAIKK